MDILATKSGHVSTAKSESDCSRRTGYKPELLIQYDKHDVAFTAWLANVETLVYAGHQCYVLQFNLHFMNGLSERKRFRGAKFELDVHSSSGTETPEMMFVRPVSDAKLVQGLVLPPNVARWKICEPPKGNDGIPQHVRLQAMVRCRGAFAIQVKDFQVKIGYRDWLRPDRVLQASHKSQGSESSTLGDSGISGVIEDRNALASTATSSETGQNDHQTIPGSPGLARSIPTKLARQGADGKSILQPSPKLVDSERSAGLLSKQGAKSDQSSRSAYDIFSSFQAWLDSSRNCDKSEKLNLQALQEFMSAAYEERGVALQSGTRASATGGEVSPYQRHSTRDSNSRDMDVMVGELNSESDLLEAWLRRERLRKKAIETCLDTANWDASSRTRRRASQFDRRASGSQVRPHRPYEATKQRHYETVKDLEHTRKETVPKRIDTESEKGQSSRRTARTAPSPPGNRVETRMDESKGSIDQSKGEALQRVWTTHESIPEVSTANSSTESGLNWTRPRVAWPTDADRRWSPTIAWKELCAAN